MVAVCGVVTVKLKPFTSQEIRKIGEDFDSNWDQSADDHDDLDDHDDHGDHNDHGDHGDHDGHGDAGEED